MYDPPPLNTNYLDISKPLMATAAIQQAQVQNELNREKLEQSRETRNALRGLLEQPSSPGTGQPTGMGDATQRTGQPNYLGAAQKMASIGNFQGAEAFLKFHALTNKDAETKGKEATTLKTNIENFTTLARQAKANPSAYPNIWRNAGLAGIELMHPKEFVLPDGTIDVQKLNTYIDGLSWGAVDAAKQMESERGRYGAPFAGSVGGKDAWLQHDKDTNSVVPAKQGGPQPGAAKSSGIPQFTGVKLTQNPDGTFKLVTPNQPTAVGETPLINPSMIQADETNPKVPPQIQSQIQPVAQPGPSMAITPPKKGGPVSGAQDEALKIREKYHRGEKLTPEEMAKWKGWLDIKDPSMADVPPYREWSGDEKNTSFDEWVIFGKNPFTGRDKASAREWARDKDRYLKDMGIDMGDVALARADIKAGGNSYYNQKKLRGMMGSFITNLNAQVDRANELTDELIGRIGVRALDIPFKSIKKSGLGQAEENILEMYMTEISNEAAKLSTNSSASIAELSVGAQDRWAKIHDTNLSFRERVKILNETKRLANERLKSVDGEIEKTRGFIRTVGSGLSEKRPKEPTPSSEDYKKSLEKEFADDDE